MRHYRRWTKPLRGIAVARTVGFRAEACRLSRLVPIDFHTDAPLRKHGCAACSTSPFAQGAPHDKPSPAHDRGHAGAESRPEYPVKLPPAGVPFCRILQTLTGPVGAGSKQSLTYLFL